MDRQARVVEDDEEDCDRPQAIEVRAVREAPTRSACVHANLATAPGDADGSMPTVSRRLAWVGLAVLAAYAVFIGGAWFGIYYPALRLMSVVAAGVVLGAWAVLAVRDPAWRPRSALLPAILVCLMSLAISTVVSRRLGISLEYLAYAVLLAALYLLLVQLMEREFFRRRFATLAGLLFVAVVAGYLVFTVVHWANWLRVLGRLTVPPLRPEFESLTFGNPSTVLTMVALLAMPIVAAADWTRRRGVGAVVLVLGVVGVVAFISGSRSGWLALAIAGGVGLAASLLAPSGRAAIRAASRGALDSIVGRAVLAVVLVGVAAVVVLLGPAVVQRVTAGGESNRVAFLRIALEMFERSPFVGTGPGTWVIQRPALTLPTEPDEYIPHAHNVYAQTLAELGVVGALAGLVLVALLLRLLSVAMRDQDVVRRRLGWVTAIGLVYFAAHQALDFYPNFPSILFAAAIPVAWLDATRASRRAAANEEAADAGEPPHRPKVLGRFALAGAILALVVSLVGLGWQELPALTGARAVDLANRGAWAAADAPAREAAARDPRVSSYLFTAGLTAAHAGDHIASMTYFQLVTQTDDVPEAWLNLAAEQVAAGLPARAPHSIERALRLGFQRPAVLFAAADLALRIDAQEIAVQAFTSAVTRAPSLLGDLDYWGSSQLLQQMRPTSLALAAEAAGPDLEWELALMSDHQDAARDLAMTPGLEPSTVDFVDAWGGDDAAYQRLTTRCIAEPFNLQLLFWCARIEGRRGNDAKANDYRYLANAQVGGTYRSGAELRVATTPMVGRSLEGNAAVFWGLYTYRRYTPWDVLVPSLVHLTLE